MKEEFKFDMNFSVEFYNVEGFGLSKVYFNQGMTEGYAVIDFSTDERWVAPKDEAVIWLLNRGCSQTTLEKLFELNDEGV